MSSDYFAGRARMEQLAGIGARRKKRESWADTDPDVLRYREERERRTQRVDPRLAEAKRALAEQVAREQAARTAGRPKKPGKPGKPGIMAGRGRAAKTTNGSRT